MLALVVNPVAGVGGPAGLAGSDGAAVQVEAAERGARPQAGERARVALEVVAAHLRRSSSADGVDASRDRARVAGRPGTALRAASTGRLPVVLTAAGAMGEDAVRAAGLEPRVVYRPSVADHATSAADTTAADTTAAVRALVDAGATLVLFAGGDGTARDVAAGLSEAGRGTATGSSADGRNGSGGTSMRHADVVVDDSGMSPRSSYRASVPTAWGGRPGAAAVAALGIPAGVKMYSPVFAVSPRAAGALAAAWSAASGSDGALPVQEREVLDIDEAAMRRARVEPRLYGTMPVPYRAGRTQSRKAATPVTEQAAVAGAARGAAMAMRPGIRYLLGPGGTMAELARELGVAKTPLGVDVVLDGRVVRAGASEHELVDEISRGPAKAVVSVIGGQGFLLGRGNQQLSARVLRLLDDDPLMVVAPEQKLIDLGGRPLLVDTGDPLVDARLAGFARVITGPSTTSLYPVHAPDAEASEP
ncbi:NAD(+)/NADH kinase [Agromyces sp. H3Y2-19a]|uniref:ATP-NAD kinase family protein n=1 Tax=Agromyces chromiiresistens TaxID=3030835 RepID=UPI0023B901C2|nr:NAD(+)/NADH kinase [Agromyces chromiiresistens]MDF0514480.1 NAD(+)/NADH kinase [Agromyces chromiiresistens]